MDLDFKDNKKYTLYGVYKMLLLAHEIKVIAKQLKKLEWFIKRLFKNVEKDISVNIFNPINKKSKKKSKKKLTHIDYIRKVLASITNSKYPQINKMVEKFEKHPLEHSVEILHEYHVHFDLLQKLKNTLTRDEVYAIADEIWREIEANIEKSKKSISYGPNVTWDEHKINIPKLDLHIPDVDFVAKDSSIKNDVNLAVGVLGMISSIIVASIYVTNPYIYIPSALALGLSMRQAKRGVQGMLNSEQS